MRRISKEHPSILIEPSTGLSGAAVYFYALDRKDIEKSVYSVRKDKSVFEGKDWKDIPEASKRTIKAFVDSHTWDELWGYAGGE